MERRPARPFVEFTALERSQLQIGRNYLSIRRSSRVTNPEELCGFAVASCGVQHASRPVRDSNEALKSTPTKLSCPAPLQSTIFLPPDGSSPLLFRIFARCFMNARKQTHARSATFASSPPFISISDHFRGSLCRRWIGRLPRLIPACGRCPCRGVNLPKLRRERLGWGCTRFGLACLSPTAYCTRESSIQAKAISSLLHSFCLLDATNRFIKDRPHASIVTGDYGPHVLIDNPSSTEVTLTGYRIIPAAYGIGPR